MAGKATWHAVRHPEGSRVFTRGSKTREYGVAIFVLTGYEDTAEQHHESWSLVGWSRDAQTAASRVSEGMRWPGAIRTVVVPVVKRVSLYEFEMTLPTEKADDEGRLTRTKRKTQVRLYEALDGEQPYLYELGLPVVPLEAGDQDHINVMQKVPLTLDRDNVPPSYLRALRAAILPVVASGLDEEEATAAWVGEALEDPSVDAEAVRDVIKARYGEKAVVRDPSDPEATSLAMAKGYTIIEPGSFNKEQWKNIRSSGAALPASKVTPVRRPHFDPNGKSCLYPRSKWTPEMGQIVEWTAVVASLLIEEPVLVDILNTGQPFIACWGDNHFSYNVRRLGKKWFEAGLRDDVLELVIHECAHHWTGDHLSAKYHEALCLLAARSTRLALARPDLFPWMKEQP